MKKILIVAITSAILSACTSAPKNVVDYTKAVEWNGFKLSPGLINGTQYHRVELSSSSALWVELGHLKSDPKINPETGDFYQTVYQEKQNALHRYTAHLNCNNNTGKVELPIIVYGNYGNGFEVIGRVDGASFGVAPDATYSSEIKYDEGSPFWALRKLTCPQTK